eukprot:jgi/Tetstr1/420847/TSEL_011921.t3
MSLQPARVRHYPADVMAFAELAAVWLAKARASLAERHHRRGRAAPLSGTIISAVVARIAVRRRVPGRRSAPGCWSRAAREMSMETAVPIDFHEALAEAQRVERTLPFFAALLVGTADTVVALVEDDGELSRAAGRLSSKGMGDLSDPAIQLRDKHPSRSHLIPEAAYDIPVDEAAMTVDIRVPYQQ